ncbi:MAG: helix-hairpin-helix domain-containing protein [Roseibacillus sp.]|nr:helix-hairpin-helix domain-containing protein [Roseibacillus sp.]
MRTILMWLLVGGWLVVAEGLPRGSKNAETGLTTFSGCRLGEAEWADGDSFPVRFPDGTIHTLRLYGVDCFETTDRHQTDQRRLRSQRAYFGIARAGGNEQASIRAAKALGIAARDRVEELLDQPFTVHTAWADGRGHPLHKRYYAFITGAKGGDLGGLLVREGLARAFGVARSRKPGVSRDEYKERLKDEELAAASRRVGAWKHTNWELLPEERRVERAQEQEEQARKRALEKNSINPNTASRDELMRLPGIGEVMAVRIIEAREAGKFRTAADLRRVAGIGEKIAARIGPYLSFGGSSGR